jgi:hypothetical protein
MFEMNFKDLPAYQRAGLEDFYPKNININRRDLPDKYASTNQWFMWSTSLMPYVSNVAKTFWRPDTELGREWASSPPGTPDDLKYFEHKYDDYTIRTSYSINAFRFEGANGYPFGGDYKRTKVTRNSALITKPSGNAGFLGGCNWPNYGQGYESSLWRIHAWSNGKTDIVWMDGHADLKLKSSLKETDFDYTK